MSWGKNKGERHKPSNQSLAKNVKKQEWLSKKLNREDGHYKKRANNTREYW
jgi:hypothetical protein